MPAIFNRYGISFQYPENWTLEEEEMEDLPEEHHSVTVYSPGGAFWTVTVHPQNSNPVKLAAAAVKAMKEEYEGVEVEDAQDTCLDRELIGYDFSFIYLDLINTAQIQGPKRSQRHLYDLLPSRRPGIRRNPNGISGDDRSACCEGSRKYTRLATRSQAIAWRTSSGRPVKSA